MKKKKVWIPLVVVAVIIIFAIITIFLNGKSKVNDVDGDPEETVLVETVKEETLEESILVTGTIVPENEQKVFLDPEHGDIQEYFIDENAKVKAGDSLFVYSETTLDNEIKSAKRNVDMIRNSVSQEENQIAQMNKQIQQLRNEQGALATERANQQKAFEQAKKDFAACEKAVDDAIAQAKKEAEQAKKDEEKTKEKDKKSEKPKEGAAPPSKADCVEPYYDEIPTISNEEITALEIERDALVLQLDSTKSEIETAEDAVKALEEAKENLTVKSKISGTVVKIEKNIDPANSGSEPVIHIISDEPFKVIGSMSEFDTVKIKPGQEVVIRPKVFKDREWKGSVESVSEYPEGSDQESYDMYGGSDGALTMYPFKVTIDGDTSDLRQGFHVSLEVIAKGDKPSTVISHGALLDDMMMDMDDEMGMSDMLFGDFSYEEPSQFVYVLVDGIIERRDVEVGNMSDEYVEITYGLEVGELVIVYPSPSLYEGMEVTDYDEAE